MKETLWREMEHDMAAREPLSVTLPCGEQPSGRKTGDTEARRVPMIKWAALDNTKEARSVGLLFNRVRYQIRVNL